MNFYILCLLGFIISLALLLILMPIFIKTLNAYNISQTVSEYSLEEYKQKAKTPIMGGLLFVVLPIIAYAIINFKGLASPRVLFILLSYLCFCAVGFVDDFLIIIKKNNDGISPRTKLIAEFIIMVVLYLIFKDEIATYIHIPFTSINLDLGFVYVPFMILLFLAEANAVNFTDGMDGLCAGVSFIGLAIMLIILCKFNEYNIAIFVTCVLGGLLGYLRFNYHPAKIFMGDSGSLALGGLITAIAVICKLEIALFFIGGIFVIEMFCVCLQLSCVKLFHKRIFTYTPIHYAFVIKGYKEKQIVPCFYVVGLILGLIGLLLGLH